MILKEFAYFAMKSLPRVVLSLTLTEFDEEAQQQVTYTAKTFNCLYYTRRAYTDPVRMFHNTATGRDAQVYEVLSKWCAEETELDFAVGVSEDDPLDQSIRIAERDNPAVSLLMFCRDIHTTSSLDEAPPDDGTYYAKLS